MQPPAPSFRAHPYVCGALGTADPVVLRRLLAASPAPLLEHYDGPGGHLSASHALPSWSSGPTRGFLWNPLAEGPRPTSTRGAAESRLAAGLAVDDTGVVLHADALGLVDVYTRRVGDSVYFASRIDPLTRIVDTLLTQDETAWASILALGAPLGAATPFEEISRLRAAEAMRVEETGQWQTSRFMPTWVEAVGAAPEPEEVADLLRRAVPDESPIAVTLSGGWDSRLLAALAAQRSEEPMHAWTTDTDTRRDRDLRLAAPVAEALGAEHHVVVPGPRSWARHASAARHRLNHQTWMHTWLKPLAIRLRDQRLSLLDGLAGDVLLKSLFVDDDLLRAEDPATALWHTLGGWRLKRRRLLAPGVADEVASTSRGELQREFERFAGHPSGLALTILATRTARAVAPAPLWLFAPETRVHVPFVHPEVLAAALRVPVGDKLGGRFYRRLLESAAGAHIAALPSTNDSGLPATGQRRRRQTHPAALAAIATTIGKDEGVLARLGPQLREAVTEGRLRRLADMPPGQAVLQWAALMADWRDTYRDRLVA